MCMTYYTVDDLRPGRPGWDVRQFSALAEAIDHYRTLPMNGVRVLGMADDAHAYELIRCVRLFPGDAQGEDVLAADYRRNGLTKRCRPESCAGRLLRKPASALFVGAGASGSRSPEREAAGRFAGGASLAGL